MGQSATQGGAIAGAIAFSFEFFVLYLLVNLDVQNPSKKVAFCVGRLAQTDFA